METNTCPTCHALIPANAPGGFCPACLLRDAEETPTYGHSAPPLEEIATAFPQWEVLGLIGHGGMGFVYKVRQPGLDRIVALKILSPELGRDPAFAERFAREARTLGKLHHPNIVTIFEHGKVELASSLLSEEAAGKMPAPLFYLLMGYCDGVNLRQAMRAGRFTPEQALAIVPGICDALQAAHAQGIWHRDIKPENILLDREGKVKIADFGIARIVGDPQQDFTLTRTGNALGSVSYMAPEQHEKPHEVDHRADIYSLGVVIYEMLTGELPLGRFPAPSQRTSVNALIDEIVFKTLEKERELRQQSVTEVKTEVHRAMTAGDSQKPLQAALASPQETFLGKLAFGSVSKLRSLQPD
jgi:serine/threonine protein kinase